MFTFVLAATILDFIPPPTRYVIIHLPVSENLCLAVGIVWMLCLQAEIYIDIFPIRPTIEALSQQVEFIWSEILVPVPHLNNGFFYKVNKADDTHRRTPNLISKSSASP